MAKVLDHGYIDFIDSWGSDERIIEAARMSTAKGFQGWGTSCTCWESGSIRAQDLDAQAFDPHCKKCNGTGKIPGDEKLLRYLWEHKHHTPFEMAGLTIEVQAPIFVFREWMRHRTQSYNELSSRYTELPDMCYVPSTDRLMNGKQAKKNKQSSEAGFTIEEADLIQRGLKYSYSLSRDVYEDLLRRGVAREIARLVVPVAQYSRMRASANLRNWLAFTALRSDPTAQWEIRQYSDALCEIISEHFPQVWNIVSSANT